MRLVEHERFHASAARAAALGAAAGLLWSAPFGAGAAVASAGAGPVALCGIALALAAIAQRRAGCRARGVPLPARASWLCLALVPATLLLARAALPLLAQLAADGARRAGFEGLITALAAHTLSGALSGLWLAAACLPLQLAPPAEERAIVEPVRDSNHWK